MRTAKNDFHFRPTPLGWLILALFSAALVTSIYYAVTNAIIPFVKLLITHWDALQLPIAGVLTGLVFGLFLVALKIERPRVYGFVEIVFAIITMAMVAVALTDTGWRQATIFVTYFGGVYVFVRGLNNVWESLSDGTKMKIKRELLTEET